MVVRLLLALVVIWCGACRGDRSTGGAVTPAPPTTSRPAFKVALLSPGPIGDAGWNAAAYQGLKRIEAELGAEVAQVETKTPPEFEEGYRDYAARGFQLVFGHGFEYQDAAVKVGAEFPGTVFITSGGSAVRTNVAPIVFRLEEATYLLGMTAALWSADARVGAVGGMEIPSVTSTFVAYQAGFASIRPGVPLISAYVGNWEDVSAAKEATLAQIRNGATHIFQNADAAGLGVLRAVAEVSSDDHPVYAFGSNLDQAAVAPTAVLASAVLDVPAAFVQVARAVREGSFKARVMDLGMREQVVSLVWNPALLGRIPSEVMDRVEDARGKILRGEFEVPRGN